MKKRRFLALLLAFVLVFSTVFTDIPSAYAKESEDDSEISKVTEEVTELSTEEVTTEEVATEELTEVTTEETTTEELTEVTTEDTEEDTEETTETVSDEPAEVSETEDDVLEELIMSDDEISAERTISGFSNTNITSSNTTSWRSNWSTFFANCANVAATTSGLDCSGYVSAVLSANGEMSGRLTTAGFASNLSGMGYTRVSGLTECISGSSLTSAGRTAIESIQSGDILLWYHKNSNGSYTVKHIGIGYVYNGGNGMTQHGKGGSSSIDTEEVCMIQSAGTPTYEYSIETIAYYLSGAGAGTSYGDTLEIWRKSSNVNGGLMLKKLINGFDVNTNSAALAGVDISGVKFVLYKIDEEDQTLTYDTIKSGRVATFVPSSTANETGLFVVGEVDTSKLLSKYQSVNQVGNTILYGLPGGHYAVFEETDVTGDNGGHDFLRVNVTGSNDQTIAVTYHLNSYMDGSSVADADKYMGYLARTYNNRTYTSTGVHHDRDETSPNTALSSSYGGNPQYFITFTIEEDAPVLKEVVANNRWTYSFALKKSSTASFTSYTVKDAVYAVYDNSASAAAATSANYTGLSGYVGALTTLDAYGNSNTITGLEGKTYYVKEVISPKGHGLDTMVYACDMTDNTKWVNGVYTLSVKDESDLELKLIKSSSNTSITANNNCYSVKGATYAVYKGKTSAQSATKDNYTSLTGYVGALVTDATGKSNTLSKIGVEKVYVKEVIAPPGYALDSTVYTVDFTDAGKMVNDTYTLSVTDKPQMDPISVLLTKKDSADNTPVSGAEYTIKYYAGSYGNGVNPATLGKTATRTWVVKTDSTGYAVPDNSHKVSGDAWYYNSSNQVQFPLGTVTIQETKAPQGYKLDNTVYVRKITAGGTAETVTTYNAVTVSETENPNISTSATDGETGTRNASPKEDTVIYDDVRLTNILVGKTYTIKGVLMNKDTGEALLIDGEKVTAEETFTADATDMTVRMEYKFDATGLEGVTTVVFEDLYVGSTKVAAHADLKDEDQTVEFPKIHTTALGTDTDEHLAYAGGETTSITDTVYYSGLLVGKEYTIKGVLMNKNTGLPVMSKNATVTAEKTFTAETQEGYVELEFVFDASLLAGETAVVFEDLYYEGIELATHSDIEDEEQTVYFPIVHTTATEKTKGTHETMSNEKYELVDTVYYSGLIVGREYVVRGTVMNAKTGKALTYNGEEVTGYTRFTAEETEGSVDVEFTFGGRDLADVTTVVFENLYLIVTEDVTDDEDTDNEDADNEVEEKEVIIADHSDLEDSDQSVYIDYTKVHISKIDDGTGELLSGAELTLYDADGKFVESWTSGETEHVINNLKPGTYTLVETAAPEGYNTAEPIEFKVEDISDIQTVQLEDNVITGKVHITKVDNIYPDKTLSGVTFNLYKTGDTIMDKTVIDTKWLDAYENLEKADKEKADKYKVAVNDLYVGTYTTDENGEISVENLTYGVYYLIETETQKGYYLLDTITGFEINAENTENELVIENEGRVGWITYRVAYGSLPARGGKAVKTGDNTPIKVVVAVMCFALAMAVLMILIRRKKKGHTMMLLALGLVFSSHFMDISVKAAEVSDETETYTETKQAEYDTDDKTAYDLGFDDEIELDGISYKLDGIEYDVENKYDKEMSGKDIEYTLTKTYSDVTEDYKAKESIKKNGYTYNLTKTNFKVSSYTPVDISSYVDTEYVTEKPTPADTISYTYTDEETGKEYEVELPYLSTEVISAGYYIPITLTGTVGDFSSEYFIYNGERYLNPGDNLSGIENILVGFAKEKGYSPEDYQNLTYGYSGDVYENADGVLVRDFYVSFDYYGEKYRFNYADSFEELVENYDAECTYEIDADAKETLELLKSTYDVTGNAKYVKIVPKKKFYQTTVGKAVISAAVIFILLIIVSLAIYIIKGGRKDTDYRSRRDSRHDYNEI